MFSQHTKKAVAQENMVVCLRYHSGIHEWSLFSLEEMLLIVDGVLENAAVLMRFLENAVSRLHFLARSQENAIVFSALSRA